VTPSSSASASVAQLATLPTWLLVVLGVLAVAEVVLDVVALVDLSRRPRAQVALGNKWIWVILIVLLNLIGAILYFAIGRQRPPQAEGSAQPTQQRPDTAGIADTLYGPRDDTKPQ
jgi:hypothetical protein